VHLRWLSLAARLVVGHPTDTPCHTVRGTVGWYSAWPHGIASSEVVELCLLRG
jgi:hypothetical protein